MKYIVTLDQGTTSSRAIIFDSAGEIKGIAQREFSQYFPHPGWVEHDAEEIWNTQRDVFLEVLGQAKLSSKDIHAVGITNQRETVVIWDRRTGKPVSRAIVWQDRRTAQICENLRGHADTIAQKTGLVLDPYFSATKIQWMLDNIPGVRANAEASYLAAGTIDSWLVWKLTGGKVHITDATNASRTMLYNLHSGGWDQELLELFRIPASLLPKVVASSEVYGEIELEQSGFSGVPIAGIAGDQQSSLFGQACFAPGMVKNTYGTGCFLLMNTGTKPVQSKNSLVSTVAWKTATSTEYALEGSIFVAGAVVQWLRDGLGIISSSSEVEALALTVPDTGGVFLVPAFAGLGAPHWDPHARGNISGLTRGSTRGHIARAALEGIAFQVADVLRAMEADSKVDVQELRVDGGASANKTLMQFQADILDVPVVCSRIQETTALGAAYLAGLATGYWKSRDETAAKWKAGERYEPRIAESTRTLLLEQWSMALNRARSGQ